MKETKGKEQLAIKKLSILIIVVVGLTIVANILSDKKQSSSNSNITIGISNNTIENKIDEFSSINIERLKNMKERDRMEYYFSYWLQLVEDGKYELAYEILYPEFRENYFATVSEFIDYCKKTFPKMSSLNHTNIERNGDTYVLWIEITDILNGTKDDSVKMNVVIKEKDFAEIEMSFSVI